MDNAKDFLYMALYCILFATGVSLLVLQMKTELNTVRAIKTIICENSNLVGADNSTIQDASVLTKADLIAMVIAGPTTDFSVDGIEFSSVKFEVDQFPFNLIRSKYYKKIIEYDNDGNVFIVRYNTI